MTDAFNDSIPSNNVVDVSNLPLRTAFKSIDSMLEQMDLVNVEGATPGVIEDIKEEFYECAYFPQKGDCGFSLMRYKNAHKDTAGQQLGEPLFREKYDEKFGNSRLAS